MSRFQPSFVEEQLSAGERLAEVLFGLIMTLTFTLGAGVLLLDEPEAARSLLAAALGCNVAWGIIDGALVILGRVFDRSRPARLARTLRQAGDAQDPLSPVAAELDDVLVPLTDPKTRSALYASIAQRVRDKTPAPLRIPREDWLAAAAAFWLVFFASLPAVLPFLIVRDAWIALRISNLLLLALLFFVSFRWAAHVSRRPWRVAAGMTAVGIALVAIAVALGG
jgi:hypothetical protein